jgi:biopolymer transport protein ExbD
MYNIYKRNGESEEEINISPLIDMVFILLIFFIVTTTFSRDTGVVLNKPKAKTAQTITREHITVAVTPEGSIHILDKQVDIDQLRLIIERLVRENPDRQALIVVDKSSPSGTVVDVIDSCNLCGVKKVNIAALKN